MLAGLSGISASLFHVVVLAFDQWNLKLLSYLTVRVYGVVFGLLIVLQVSYIFVNIYFLCMVYRIFYIYFIICSSYHTHAHKLQIYCI